jgi:hypothetical protein
MKKHHWHVFRHEKIFKKQPLPHYQTHIYFAINRGSNTMALQIAMIFKI